MELEEEDQESKRIFQKPNGFEESEGNFQEPKKADNDNEDDNVNDNDLKKENIKKKYGENGNVKFTDEEYEKVKTYFPKDYAERIQALDDYIQSKGKKYKDFFATLKTWARKDGYKPPSVSEPKKEQYKEIDTSQLSQEDYGRLMRRQTTIEKLIEEGKLNV
ncbi:MAG: hypothetical protein HFJ30_00390 [Clostridia bacterium]|jgi:hypothetical protein|nr:hypothetical protein [Clostridia bacterium]